jgi:two-component system NtrC family sensor kinase
MVKFRKSLHSLAGKLILTVGALMTVGGLLLGYFLLGYERQVMYKNITSYAHSFTGLVMRSLQHAMLTGRREIIQQNIDVLSEGDSTHAIRIYDARGRVAFSSAGSEIGTAPYEAGEFSRRLSEAVVPGIEEAREHDVLRFTVPILNEPRCFTSKCHFHPEGQKALGLLETSFLVSEMHYLTRHNTLATLALIGVFVLLISVCLCIILYNFVSKPVALLEAGMKRISRGELDQPIDIRTKDEMGLLAGTFNSMARDLKEYRRKMENFTRSLEEEVKKKTEDIMEAQEELLNAEKLASLGRMSAGVAHELNSPLTGIVTFAHLLKSRTPPDDRQAHEDLQVIIDQANRCAKIIKGLLGFSRRAAFEIVEVSINDLLDSTVGMIRNQAKFHNIRFNINLSPGLPGLQVDPNQMQQVFLNLIINAVDAMGEKGTVFITTRLIKGHDEKDTLEIEFTDTGPGIPEEHIGKIFEPFFTTKPVGKGTGLGLSVSYGIVKRHGGEIIAKSQPGRGASFFVRIPVPRKRREE